MSNVSLSKSVSVIKTNLDTLLVEFSDNEKQIDKITTALKSNTTIHIKEFGIAICSGGVRAELEHRKRYLLTRNQKLLHCLSLINQQIIEVSFIK